MIAAISGESAYDCRHCRRLRLHNRRAAPAADSVFGPARSIPSSDRVGRTGNACISEKSTGIYGGPHAGP